MIRRLLQLNGLAIIGVVVNHTIGWGFVAMFWWTDRYLPVAAPDFGQLGTSTYYGLRTAEQIVMGSIPIFLFVSGFFVAVSTGRANHTIGWRAVGTRITSLIIPYLVWSFIIFGVDYALLDVQYTPLQYLRLLAVGGATPAFYYVPLLCQLYLLAPLLAPLARTHWRTLLAFTLIMQAYVLLAEYNALVDIPIWGAEYLIPVYSWAFPGYIFWFALGTVVGFHLPAFKETIGKLRWSFLASAVFMLPIGVLEWELLLRGSGQEWLAPVRLFTDELFSGLIIFSFLAFSSLALPLSGRLSELGARSFGVYLVHSLVLMWAAKAIYHLAPLLLANQLLYQSVLITLGIGIPLLLMALVKRSPLRPLYPYIFG